MSMQLLLQTTSTELNNESGVDSEAQTLTSSDEIALLGKPKLGELYKCTVRIKESKEFKVCCDELLFLI